MSKKRLGVGFIGSGFNTRFHLQAFQGVRDADVLGIWSPNPKRAGDTANFARQLDVGPARAYRSIAEMVADPAIDALWLCGPNQARIENVEEIVDTIKRGRGELKGLASEKPLARNVEEAKQVVKLVNSVGLQTGYLENQLFSPGVTRGRDLIWARGAALTGRPYLARAAEEHSGPHMPWFWQGRLQGGGVLNDMMCHSVEVVRFLLTKPGDDRAAIRPVRLSARIASLKWSRPEYARRLARTMGKEVDYLKRPSEDFASVSIEFEDRNGLPLIGEATTSWSFVGAGLRLSGELLGPEYSMTWNTLESELKLFFSREVKGKSGEDLVEKQNAEMGLMPVVPNEPAAYGYEAEDRHFVRVFLKGEKPLLTFADGLEVVKILMAAYMAAESGRTIEFPPRGLDKFRPAVAKGMWRP
ncbi:MAG TPA: Gfo/Idh/MocA family oxidoreductase [Gemmatimonadales bacterium]|nr:Gfo/Idh/MocA family oxidoreductase [Gemmatimonadales bacterium]